MGRIALFAIIIFIIIKLVSCTTQSDYERAQDSFGDRLRTGDFSGMSDLEIDVANGFFDWVSEQ